MSNFHQIDCEEKKSLLPNSNLNINSYYQSFNYMDVNMNKNHIVTSNSKCDYTENVCYPRLYEFIPTEKYPKVRIYSERSLDSALKAIIRLKALILVISDDCGDLNMGKKAELHTKNDTSEGRYGEDIGWYYIYCSGFEGWTHIPDGWKCYVANDPKCTSPENGIFHTKVHYKRYEDFKGNNYFLWDGQLMFGADLYTFYFCNFAILTPSLCLLFFVCPEVKVMNPLYCVLGFTLMLVYCMFNLWCTALTEPGILPRNPPNIKVVRMTCFDANIFSLQMSYVSLHNFLGSSTKGC